MKRQTFKLFAFASYPLWSRGSVVSLMAGTNAFVLPYLSYCRRHLSRRHSGRAREKKRKRKNRDSGVPRREAKKENK